MSIGAEDIDCIVVPMQHGRLIKLSLLNERIRTMSEELEKQRDELGELLS